MKNSTSFDSLLKRPNLMDELESELAVRSFREFVRQAWPIVEPSTPFVPGWHIDAIIDHLEAVTRGDIRNLLINVPPRHMKSLLVSVFWPAWEWLRHPERRWLFSSYGAQLSIRDSVKCRRLIESPWYQQHWADRLAKRKRKSLHAGIKEFNLKSPVFYRTFSPDELVETGLSNLAGAVRGGITS